MAEELRRLTVADLLEREDLANELFSRGRQPIQQLHLQFYVAFLLQRRSDDVLHPCGVPMVHLRDYVVKFSCLIADTSEREPSISFSEAHTAGRSTQNGGSRMGTQDVSADWEPFVASMLCRVHQCSVRHRNVSVCP